MTTTYVCPFCGTSHAARNAPDGGDIACCGEVGHVEAAEVAVKAAPLTPLRIDASGRVRYWPGGVVEQEQPACMGGPVRHLISGPTAAAEAVAAQVFKRYNPIGYGTRLESAVHEAGTVRLSLWRSGCCD